MTERFAVSPRMLCEEMRRRGIPEAIAKAKIGATFDWFPKGCRIGRVIWLRHDEKFPIEHWAKVLPEDRARLPRHQWPVDPDGLEPGEA
jgi:hypothetical protein